MLSEKNGVNKTTTTFTGLTNATKPSAKPNKTVDKDASTMREILKDMDEKFVPTFIGIEPR